MKNPIHKTFNTIHLIYNGSRMRWIALIFPVLIFLFIFENMFFFFYCRKFLRGSNRSEHPALDRMRSCRSQTIYPVYEWRSTGAN